MKKKLAVISIFIICAAMVGNNTAYAADLSSAANNAASHIKMIAQILAVTGVVAGGAIMQLPGLGFFGKSIMTSGLVCCLCAYGAPGFQSLMTNVFGS